MNKRFWVGKLEWYDWPLNQMIAQTVEEYDDKFRYIDLRNHGTVFFNASSAGGICFTLKDRKVCLLIK